MAYDTLPHNWSYQDEVMQTKNKTFCLGKNDGGIPFKV